MSHWVKCTFYIYFCHSLTVLAVYACSNYRMHIIFYSLRCNTKHKKRLLILHIINILLVSFLYFNPANRCDADIMEKHYTKYGDHMEQIYRNLYDELTPGCYVDIEFEHGHVSIFHFQMVLIKWSQIGTQVRKK